MKKSKKLLSLALSVVLSLSMLSQVAFASGNTLNAEAQELAQELLAADLAELEIRQSSGISAFSANVDDIENGADIDYAQDVFDNTNFTSVEANELVTYDLENELSLPDVVDEIATDKSTQDTFNDVQFKENAEAKYPFEKNAKSRAQGINNPNAAIYLDNSLLNVGLSNLGDSNEDWYYFSANAGNKISASFAQPSSGDYDTYLYQLNGSTLSLVAYSENANSASELINYLATATGNYYLRVIPYIAASPSEYYDFAVFVTTPDSAELNDFYTTAKSHSGSISVNQTIDNVFDEDWFKYTTSSTNYWYNEFSLANVPNGADYAVVVYDQNLKALSSFQSTSSAAREWSLGKNTTYYIRVFSVNGNYSDTQAYQLKVTPKVQIYGGNTLMTTPGGNLFEIYNGRAYVDGVSVDMSWGTESRTPTSGMPWTSRAQSIGALSGGIKILDGYSTGGSYSGYSATGSYPFVISSNNVIRVAATDFYYFFYYYRSPNADYTIPSDNLTFTEDYKSEWGDAIYFYIDANTKKLIDVDLNLYYWQLNYSQSFR